MIYKNAFLTILITITSCLGWAGSEVGNGGGIAEKNFIFAYENLAHYLSLCLSSKVCPLTDKERTLVEKIVKSLDGENKDSLIFDSEKKKGGFFKIDGQIRVAKTGDHVGDPIYINSDLIYTESVKGDFKAVDVPLAVSILTHELGHHHGEKNHDLLDQMGTKIQIFLLTQTTRTDFWNGHGALYSLQLNIVKKDDDKKYLKEVDQVILEYKEIYDLSGRFVQGVHCPKKDEKLKGLRIYNLHDMRGVKYDSKSRLLKKHFQAWYILSCKEGAESDHGDLDFFLTFKKLNPQGEDFDFRSDLTEVRQTSCLQNQRVCK